MERGWEPPVLPLTVSLLPTPTRLSKSVQTLQLYNFTQEHRLNLCTPSLIVPQKSNHSLGRWQENFIPDHPNAPPQTHTSSTHRQGNHMNYHSCLSHHQLYFSSSIHVSIASPQAAPEWSVLWWLQTNIVDASAKEKAEQRHAGSGDRH